MDLEDAFSNNLENAAILKDRKQVRIDWSLRLCLWEAVGNFSIIVAIHLTHSAFIMVPAALFVLVYFISPLTQAHFNASVTLLFSFLERHHNLPRSSKKKILSFVFSQVLGSLLGGLLVCVIWTTDSFMRVSPHNISLPQALVWEFMWTSILLHVVCEQVHPANRRGGLANALTIFFLIFVVSTIAGPHSGGLINPSISLASGLMNLVLRGDVQNLLVDLAYCLVQLAAVPVAFYTYKFILCDAQYPEGQMPRKVEQARAPEHTIEL